jgi:hypothetical protein
LRYQSVQQLALAVRQRADIGGQQNAFGGNSGENITDIEMLTMLNASVSRVWKAMVRMAPENYAWGDGGTGTGGGYIFPSIQGKYRYQLPFDFLKEKGVDLALDNSGQNWASMRPYTEKDRNLFSFPLQTALAYAGWQNMRWQIQGNWINILPQTGPLPSTIRLLYAPTAPILCGTLPVLYAASTSYTQGQLVYVPLSVDSEPAINQVFVALNSGTSGSGYNTVTIGSGNGALTYTGVQANVSVLIVQAGSGTSGSASVTASTATSVTIVVDVGSLGNRQTAGTMASVINDTPAVAAYVTALAGGDGTSNASVADGSITPWAVPGTASDNGITWAYQGPSMLFANGFDGINGWEDLVVLDCAIKCGVKQEQDVSAMMAQKAEWKIDLEEDLADRNQGDPMVLSGGFGMCEGGPAYGNGFGPFGGGAW